MKLCKYCIRKILESEKYGDNHHGHRENFESAAAQNCVFCRCLWDDSAELRQSSTPLNPIKMPWYKWSIRKLARIRESQETFIVTFRPLATTWKLIERKFYLFPEAELRGIPEPKELKPSTRPDDSVPQIKKWLSDCNDDPRHECCKNHTNGPLPTRLVDVDIHIDGHRNDDLIKVVDTKTLSLDGDKPPKYLTLSHCWGAPKKVKYETFNQETAHRFRIEGFPLNLLSRIFQEAITLTRQLGIKYIWIDSLCISQDPDNADFHREGNFMHLYYRNSYCNIVAADSKDGSLGVFRPLIASEHRDLDKIILAKYEPPKNVPMSNHKTWRVLPGHFFETEVLGSHIYTRAWVFQERMLSPRLLHFTRHQVFWECASVTACETIPSGLPYPVDSSAAIDRNWRGRLQVLDSHEKGPLVGRIDDSIEEFWKSAVFRYTHCDITRKTDKPLAIWGVAKLVRDELQKQVRDESANALNPPPTDLIPSSKVENNKIWEEYGGGLWSGQLAEQLAWKVDEGNSDERTAKDLSLIPSWSWASTTGAIIVPNRLERRQEVVKDHCGQPIAFNLKQPIKELKASESHHGSARGVMPEIEMEIAIRGHLGQALLEYNYLTKKWTLQIPKGNDEGRDDTVFEVFPDVQEDIEKMRETSQSCTFIVLALSYDAESDAGASPERPEMPTALKKGKRGNAQLSNFSGAGILLERTAAHSHHPDTCGYYFRRIGAFQFSNASQKTWACVEDLYQFQDEWGGWWNEEKGLAFYLI